METRVVYNPLKHKWALEVKNSLGWGAVAYGKELECQMLASQLVNCWNDYTVELEKVAIMWGRA